MITSRSTRPLRELVQDFVLGAAPSKYAFTAQSDMSNFRARMLRLGDLPADVNWIDALPPEADPREELFTDTPAVRRAELREGDVLIVARGGGMRVALVGRGLAGCVASANLMILRPNPNEILGAVLAWWFALPDGRAALEATDRGTTLPSLDVAAIKEIEVPVPSLDVQHGLAELLVGLGRATAADRALASSRRDLAVALARRAFPGEL